MIGKDLDAKNVLADIVALNSSTSIDAELTTLCTDISQTVAEPSFPGALVPAIKSVGDIRINVAMPNVSDWRRLKPILLAFAGPTLTGFDGVPGDFDLGDAVGARI